MWITTSASTRLRPVKLFEAGVVNQALLTVFLDNSRIPDMNWGDIKAMVAAVNSCERKVHELIAKFGIETVRESMTALLDHVEQRVRSIFAAIPDGTYSFLEYMEDDMVSDVPVRWPWL